MVRRPVLRRLVELLRVALMPPEWIERANRTSTPRAPEPEPPAPPPEPPPKRGRGSGIGAWREHAAALGIAVPDGATRDAIIELVENPPVEVFGPRGRRLWNDLADKITGEAHRALLEEACRIVDRLDQLDALLKGDASQWCRIETLSPRVVELRVDSPLIEARQQANTLRQIVAALPLEEQPRDGDDEDGWLKGLV